eukprot:scaffold13671_cov72-Skeletonema_dohrnii-CCMP3373.AAC.2
MRVQQPPLVKKPAASEENLKEECVRHEAKVKCGSEDRMYKSSCRREGGACRNKEQRAIFHCAGVKMFKPSYFKEEFAGGMGQMANL